MFSVQGHITNILGFVGHIVSITAFQLSSYSRKAAIDIKQMKTGSSWIWPVGNNLSTPKLRRQGEETSDGDRTGITDPGSGGMSAKRWETDQLWKMYTKLSDRKSSVTPTARPWISANKLKTTWNMEN